MAGFYSEEEEAAVRISQNIINMSCSFLVGKEKNLKKIRTSLFPLPNLTLK